ncbi:MAG TPA: hypothetical protein K8W04_00590 [Bacteroides reticulotermitis]|nr:hypothetical protein [Bacteroides reticulotermitis]
MQMYIKYRESQGWKDKITASVCEADCQFQFVPPGSNETNTQVGRKVHRGRTKQIPRSNEITLATEMTKTSGEER